MRRLIEVDVDKLKELLNDNRIDLTNTIISIVRENYIPKADYENRLNADMAAMLEDLNLEIDEMFTRRIDYTVDRIQDLIQQKINALKENTDDN